MWEQSAVPLTLSCSPQIVFVGEIVSVSESQTNVVYKVDNRTGPLVDVKNWLADQELEAELRRVWRWPSRVCPLELRCRREDKSVERGRSLCVCVCACARTHMHVCLL